MADRISPCDRRGNNVVRRHVPENDGRLDRSDEITLVRNGIGIEARRIADIVEWSFQAAMDQASMKELGSKVVGPKSSPLLDSAMGMLNDQQGPRDKPEAGHVKKY